MKQRNNMREQQSKREGAERLSFFVPSLAQLVIVKIPLGKHGENTN